MGLLEGSYLVAQWFLLKGIAITFLLSFIIQLRQYRGLVGKNGILPLKEFVEDESFWSSISLFHFFNSEEALKGTAVSGIFLSVLALSGIPSNVSPLFSSVNWFLMWFLMLSFYNTGQEFYSHYWDLILLEAGFLCIFTGGTSTGINGIMILLFQWILFRMMLGSGLIKIHGDPAWKDLTALNYHFETQAFPNPLSWHLHQLPEALKKLGVLATHFMLLVVPFMYFMPEPYAVFAGITTVLYQIMIFASGNYTWLNLITSVLAFSTFKDSILQQFLPLTLQPVSSYPYEVQSVFLAGFIGVLSLPVLKNMFSHGQVQNKTFDPLHLVNSYGAFEDIARERNEIIIECFDGESWLEYIHYEKPGPLDQRPPQVSPYFHRMDYPFKFADKEPDKDHKWLENLLEKLLEGSEEVEKLFKETPVKNPERIRACLYSYRFSDPMEREENSRYWERDFEKVLFKKT